MKKGTIILLTFNIFFSILGANNSELIENLKPHFVNKGINTQNDSNNLLFEQQVYKKLIQENFLDELIIKSGFEPNQETRTIFFSALTKELQDVIKKSFSDFSGTSLNTNSIDPNIFMQAEMTRNLSAVINSLNSKLDKENTIKTKHLIIGGIVLYLFAKLSFLRSIFRTTFNFFKTSENVDGKSSKTFGFVNSTISKTSEIGRNFLSNFFPVDFSKDVEDAQELFGYYEFLEKYLKNDKEFVKNHAKNYEWIEVAYKDEEGVLCHRRLRRNAELDFD